MECSVVCVYYIFQAHNIEDAAREASSFEVTEADLRNLEKELENKIALDILLEQHRVILHVSIIV